MREFTAIVQRDFSAGDEILNRQWTELNNYSVIEDMNRGQRTYNAFVDESVENPAEAWKWRGTRSKARNKATAMHAQITAAYIFPSFMAQNEADEEDRDFSDMMDDAVEWLGHNSNYKSSFLLATMGMLVNPITYMGAEWMDVMQTVKEKTEEGYTKKEIRDEVLSGFNAPVYSADQILISNAYEQNIQRQRCIIKRRYIEYAEAEAKYGKHENWEHVKPGVKSLYNDKDGLFYDVKDDDHPFLIAEETALYRRDDTEVCFLNGIYMGADKVDDNPIKHRDHRGAPKYNVVPFGYSRINEHFFYYKSLMNSLFWDNQLADAQYELAMNTAFLASNMPTAFSGMDKIDSDIMFPSATIAMKDKDARAFPLLPGLNPAALFQAFGATEASMEEGSVTKLSGGQLPATSTKATAINTAQRNAQTLTEAVGKTMAESIVQYGGLMADMVVNHLSVADIEELEGGEPKLKYKTLILKNKVVGGVQTDKVLKFDQSLLGAEMTDQEKNDTNLEMYSDFKKKGGKTHISRINPELAARMKYLCRVEPETMFTKNKEYQQAIMSQVQAQYAQNPYVSLEALTRKSLYAYFGGETGELMKKADPMQQQLPAGEVPQTQFGQQAANTASGMAMVG